MRAPPALWILSGLLAACGSAAPQARVETSNTALVALAEDSAARIDVKVIAGKPRLTLLTRDGDEAPAVAVTFLSESLSESGVHGEGAPSGPAVTTALAAVVEARVRAAGFPVELRIDRDAFTVRASVADPARTPQLFAAIVAAVARPVVAGGADLALAAQRVGSLRRNPLDDPARSAVVACTGALGVPAAEAALDPASAPGLMAIETARRALDVGRIAIGAAGPASFGAAVSKALEGSDAWPIASAPVAASPWPLSDVASVYRSTSSSMRVTVAARVADPSIAAAAAARVGALDSPLADRLRALAMPWRIAEVAGVARARGGCVAIEIEPAPGEAVPSSETAALVAGIARREITAELARGAPRGTASRRIVSADDPRDAASLAAWWSLAATEPGAPTRWIIELAQPSTSATRVTTDAPTLTDAAFQAELAREAPTRASAERRVAVERGQGETWLLLASPCGVAEETNLDAGLGALAILAVTEGHRRVDGVTIEPWITSDGLGVVAHAEARDDREAPADLARRIADAAAETLTATVPTPEALRAARFAALDHLTRAGGEGGLAFAALAGVAAPDHPSWLDPFGLATRVSAAAPESVRLRGRSLALGPLRVAVIANTDQAQASAAADEVERWLGPTDGPRVCHGGAPSPPRPGRYDARTADGALAHGLIGLPLPGAPWRDLAELTSAALDGPGGLLAAAAPEAWVSARVEGGARSPMLIVDVRAPSEVLGTAVASAKAAVLGLAAGATEQTFARALTVWDERDHRTHAGPRSRLINLWMGRAPTARPTLAAWRAFLAATVRETSLVIIEARPQR